MSLRSNYPKNPRCVATGIFYPLRSRWYIITCQRVANNFFAMMIYNGDPLISPCFYAILHMGGDDLEHKENIRISDSSTTAILFIHGILGTPNHFSEFVPLVPKSVSVYNLLLDGHGKGVKDFKKTSMKKWEAQVTSVLEKLSLTHEKIYIVAHSLGTLLAIEQAIKYEKVCNLFLLAVPLRLSLKPKMFVNSLKVYFDKIRPDDYEALAAKKCYGIEKDKNPFHYVGWIPRFLELFAKIRQTRKTIKLLNTTCSVYQSRKDEMVSRRSEKYFKSNSNIILNELENSGHYYYDKADWNLLMSDFNEILNVDA